MIGVNPFQESEQLAKLFCNYLQNLSLEEPTLKRFVKTLSRMDYSNKRDCKTVAQPAVLKNALVRIRHSEKSTDELLNFSLRISLSLNWTKIYDSMDRDLSYVDGMFASRILGLDGYFINNNLSMGEMLLLPGVTYPLHTHNVDEVYYCLSGTLEIYHGIEGEFTVLKSGSVSITPQGQLHELKVKGSKPVLLIYCWLGDLRAPIWVWNKLQNHTWERTLWQRIPGKSWKLKLREPVSEALLLDFQK